MRCGKRRRVTERERKWIYAEKRKKTKRKGARNFCWFSDCQIYNQDSLFWCLSSQLVKHPQISGGFFYLFVENKK